MRQKLLLALVALLVVSLPGGPVSAEPNPLPGRVLVAFKPGAPPDQILAAHRQAGGQPDRQLPGIGVQVVRVRPGQEQAAVQAYRRNPAVRFAEADGFYRASWTPDDPLFPNQWQYPKIQATEAWDLARGDPSVTIAILDTGIDLSHSDLKAKILKSVNFTGSSTANDRYGHGTHVAGSAAAVTGNGLGVAGTCPNCTLYNVKVLDDNGSGSWSWIAEGIVWAADNGAKVINMSLGGPSYSATVEAAVNYAWEKGAVLVAAAGNLGTSAPFYPAYYSSVIAVAATDQNDQKPYWSNYGSWVDVAAPGVSILSTAPDQGNKIWGGRTDYGTISGTSMAAPHVAGIAGLVWSARLCADNTCVRSRIENGASRVAGTGAYWAYGRVNAYAALTRP